MPSAGSSTSGRPSTPRGGPRRSPGGSRCRRARRWSARDGRRLTVPPAARRSHALLLEEEVATFRTDALDRLGLTPRETEVLRAAAVIEDEAEIAWELFLSLHAVRERLEDIEAKLDVHTPKAAVTRALHESE